MMYTLVTPCEALPGGGRGWSNFTWSYNDFVSGHGLGGCVGAGWVTGMGTARRWRGEEIKEEKRGE